MLLLPTQTGNLWGCLISCLHGENLAQLTSITKYMILMRWANGCNSYSKQCYLSKFWKSTVHFYFPCQYFSYHQILRSCVNGCTGCILRRKSCWKIFIALEHSQDLEQHPRQPKALLLLLIPVLGSHESFCTIQWDSFYFISFSNIGPSLHVIVL